MINAFRNISAMPVMRERTLDPSLLSAKVLVEDDVYDEVGKCVGLIEDVLLDPKTGCVRYAVIALGGFLGLGRKRLAVSWTALTPDASYRRCVLNTAMLRLTATPIPGDYPKLERS